MKKSEETEKFDLIVKGDAFKMGYNPAWHTTDYWIFLKTISCKVTNPTELSKMLRVFSTKSTWELYCLKVPRDALYYKLAVPSMDYYREFGVRVPTILALTHGKHHVAADYFATTDYADPFGPADYKSGHQRKLPVFLGNVASEINLDALKSAFPQNDTKLNNTVVTTIVWQTLIDLQQNS